MATDFEIKDRRDTPPAWVDAYPANAIDQLLAALPASNVYALIDNGYDTGFAGRCQHRVPGILSRSLYEGRYDGPGLSEIAPTLLRVPDEPQERFTFLALLLRETSGRPMLSFLHSNGLSADPFSHLRNQMEAVDHEGTAFLIRLADTNALDAVLEVFTDTQRSRFLAGIQWWYFRRNGTLRCVSDGASGVEEADGTPYMCTAEQMEQLQALARPGAMLNLVRNSPHIFGTLVGLPSQAYACIQAVLHAASPESPMHDAVVVRKITAALNDAGLLQPHAA
ncbi:DUF4123 domain-containing protein [Arthrobacter sp. NPDC080086]|uniref:DUF4123 domain-containing protein n=1 Tax=Arthrobacter sp. NPDC080086 TaxID=3155917 RepID=UPI00344DDFE4